MTETPCLERDPTCPGEAISRAFILACRCFQLAEEAIPVTSDRIWRMPARNLRIHTALCPTSDTSALRPILSQIVLRWIKSDPAEIAPHNSGGGLMHAPNSDATRMGGSWFLAVP